MIIILIIHFWFYFTSCKTLWSLDNTEKNLFSRNLQEKKFLLHTFSDLKNPTLFSIEHDDLLNLQLGSEIIFEIPNKENNVKNQKKNCIFLQCVL